MSDMPLAINIISYKNISDRHREVRKCTQVLKLQEHVKSEADKSNSQINILRQFRGLYPTKDSLKVFTENVIVLLNHTE